MSRGPFTPALNSQKYTVAPEMSWIDRLPHRPPMRLVEEVVHLTPGDSAVGRRTVRPDDFFLDGHFPGQPVVPAIILVELLAQTGGLAAGSLSAEEAHEPIQFRVASIGAFKFLFPVTPGAMLEAHARVLKQLGRLYKIEGEVTADGRVAAVGSLTLAG